MSGQLFVRTLRPAGLWFVTLLCLTLSLPTAYLETPSAQRADKQSELIAQNYSAELLGSPVEPTSFKRHSKQALEPEAIVPGLDLAEQPSQDGANFVQAAVTTPWHLRYHQLSLPRPPPRS